MSEQMEAAWQNVLDRSQSPIPPGAGERFAFEAGYIAGRDASPTPDRVTGNGNCPCVILNEPCTPQCSCTNPVLSGGCLCCARYGSDDQRQAVARILKTSVADHARLRVAKMRRENPDLAAKAEQGDAGRP